jgi:hypothetical protein
MYRYIFRVVNYLIYSSISGLTLMLLFREEELKSVLSLLTMMELKDYIFFMILGRHMDYVYRFFKWVLTRIVNKIMDKIDDRINKY